EVIIEERRFKSRNKKERDKTVAGNGNVREVFCIKHFMSPIRCRMLGESPELGQQQAEVNSVL
ncbi:MAG: hypothetical protein IJN43_16900, partial [Ruminococcus sp.]|nr:hypothetical protein [Ruminococcus sp.]